MTATALYYAEFLQERQARLKAADPRPTLDEITLESPTFASLVYLNMLRRRSAHERRQAIGLS